MALAIRPQHPSPTSFRSQPLRGDFFSVTMDHQSQPHIRPSLPPISSLFESVRDHNDRANTDRSPHDDILRRRSAGSPAKESTSPERHSISRSPHNRPQRSPELPPASSFDFKRPVETLSPIRTGNHGSFASHAGPDSRSQHNSTYPPVPESNGYPPIDTNWSASRSRNGSESSAHDTSSASTPRNGTPVAENGLASQRPLPTFASPRLAPQSTPPMDPQLAPTWQHHHYYPATNPPSYPQTQERYICPTCSKPFSRPSSLKIHTYSHTGEKPYKCKHDGCGKHFSVRSNMKRHEKGCHGGNGGQSPPA